MTKEATVAKTYRECLTELKSNLNDWMDRMNCHIVPEYFGKVDWKKPQNWRDFLKDISMFDSSNGGSTWMKSFWWILEEHKLFDDAEFLREYFQACDGLTSVIADPAYVDDFTLHIYKKLYNQVRDCVPSGIDDVIQRFAQVWKR